MFSKRFFQKPKLGYSGLLAAVALSVIAPASAETANFGTLRLSPGFSRADATAKGSTGGSYSLSSISNRDRDGKHCLGFGDTLPDHVIVLQQDFAKLSLKVDSGGGDTTLVVQGPNNSTVRCGDDTGQNKDASVSGTKWTAGTYRVWVGFFQPGVKRRYTLIVEE